MITFMFLCTHRHSNLIIFLAVEKRQAQLFHDQLPVGWGELIRFMFLCLHTHSNLISFLAVEHLHALLFHDQLPVGWGEKDCVEGEQNRRRASTQAPLLYGNLQVKYRCHYTAAQTTAKTTSAKEPLCTQIYRSKPDAK